MVIVDKISNGFKGVINHANKTLNNFKHLSDERQAMVAIKTVSVALAVGLIGVVTVSFCPPTVYVFAVLIPTSAVWMFQSECNKMQPVAQRAFRF